VSIAALFLGPFLFRLAQTRKSILNALDGFVLVSVTGLVTLTALPHCVEAVGWWALAFAGLGLMAPTIMERLNHSQAQATHRLYLKLVMTGLIVHAALDGLALHAEGETDHHEGLHLAIIFHRVTVGVALWWLIQPVYGKKWAWGALVGMAISTTAGYAFAGQLKSFSHLNSWFYFEALIGGMLLHVILHFDHNGEFRLKGTGWKWPSGIGGLVGVGVLLALVPSGHSDGHHGDNQFSEAFWALSMESAPMLLLAYLAAGMVHAFFSESTVAWMKKGTPIRQAMRGMAFGLPLPVCSCGVVPLYQGLVSRGAPTTAAMAFLVATPELGIDAVLLSLPLLGPHMTVARVTAAALVALLVGWLIGPMAEKYRRDQPQEPTEEPRNSMTFGEKVRYGFHVGFGEVVDKTGPWITVGLVLAAAMVPILKPEWIATIPFGWDVVLFALIGMPTYVCASGATPFVAVLLLKGVSPGAALAFLLSGPATNIVTFGVLSQLHNKKVAFAFGASIAVAAIGLGLLLNLFLPDVTGFTMDGHHHDETDLVGMISALLLFGIFAISMLRQGTRPFFGQVFPSASLEDGHCHSESTDCHSSGDCGETPASHDHDHGGHCH